MHGGEEEGEGEGEDVEKLQPVKMMFQVRGGVRKRTEVSI